MVILLAVILCSHGCKHKGVVSLIRRTACLRDLRNIETESAGPVGATIRPFGPVGPVGRHGESELGCRVTDGRMIANISSGQDVAIGRFPA